MKALKLAVLITILNILFSGCSSGLDTETLKGEHVEYLHINLTEMSFSLVGHQKDSIHLEAETTYRITFENKGFLVHKFKIGSGNLIMSNDGKPSGYTKNFFEGLNTFINFDQPAQLNGKIETNNLEAIELQPGQTIEIIFSLPLSYKGKTFELGCFSPGHYQLGMKIPITVG